VQEVLSSFIAGHWAETRDRTLITLVNPATDQPLAKVALADQSDVDAAVEAATVAQRQWVKLPISARSEILWKFSLLLDSRAEELARLDTANTGKALRESLPEGQQLGKIARYWAGMTDKILGQQIPTNGSELTYTRRLPVGVVGAITPWNAPAVSTVHRITSAVACGNAVIVKPSEWSPLSSGIIAELAIKAGMPAGLVNLLVGDGVGGHALAAHRGVGAIRFTGGVDTGRKIAHAAADSFKKITLELGGKSPNIVFADADLDDAIRGSIWGIFANAGQICCAGTRLLVQEQIADEFVDRLIGVAEKVRVGDPLDESNHIGPLAFRRHYDRVLDFIEIGRKEGATVATGGARPDSVGEQGCYVAPTVFTDVQPGSRLAQEEVFGPVLSVLRFADEEHAVELANGVDLGLASMVWTQSLPRALRVADAIDAGNIWVNNARSYGPTLPFSGFKDSGVGNAMADGAIEGCTRVKRVSIAYGAASATPGWDDI
jgi:acyl-CoA reductase-like NAD-dependent aldehyde dehydrogenase